MHVEHDLPATGGVARRLLHIASLCRLDVAPEVRALAAQGLAGQGSAAQDQADDAAPGLQASGLRLQRAATQFMLDCGLRCVVPSAPHLDRALVLGAVTRAGASPVTVLCRAAQAAEWREAARRCKLRGCKFVSLRQAFQPAHQDGRREGVLVADWPHDLDGSDCLAAIAREFPRTVLHGEASRQSRMMLGVLAGTEQAHARWQEMAHCLFPAMPLRMFGLADAAFGRCAALNGAWRDRLRPADLAIFYNVFLPRFAAMPGYDFV